MASNGRATTREVYDLVDRKFGELSDDLSELREDFNNYKVKQATINAKVLMVWTMISVVGAAVVSVVVNKVLI